MYSLNKSYFEKIDSSNKAFWLGFICADGSIKSNRGNLYLKITQYHDVLLNKFKDDISFTGSVKLNTSKQKGRYSDKSFYELTIYGNEFATSLLDIGKTRYKKDQIEIPKSIPNEFIVDYIRGYFEGDGSLYFHNATNNWCVQISGVEDLLKNIQSHIGIGNIYKDKSISRLMANGNKQTKKIVDTLYYNDDVYGVKHLQYRGDKYE